MPTDKDFKRAVRARMRAVQEPYSVARRQVLAEAGSLLPPNLAAALRARRLERGWTIGEAAQALRTTKLKIGLLERGLAGVDNRLAVALADAYGLSANALRHLARLATVREQADGTDRPRSGCLTAWADAPSLWIATLGRRSGAWRPKWWITFVIDGDLVYLFEPDPDRAEWIANLRSHPELWIWARSDAPLLARGTELSSEPERLRARRLLAAKHPDHRDLVEWAQPVALSTARTVR